MRQRWTILAGTIGLAATALVLLLGLSGAAEPETSRVRLVHAVPIPAGLVVDVAVDGTPVYTGVVYKEVTPYTVWPAGFHTVTAQAPFLPPLQQTVYLTGGIDATVIGVGVGFGIEAMGLQDDNGFVHANTVRVVHLAPNTAAMDVLITGTMGTAQINALPYKGASEYVGGLGTGEVALAVRAGGVVRALDPPTATLQSDAVHTLFIMGAGSPLDLVASVDQAFETHKVFLPLVIRPGAGP